MVRITEQGRWVRQQANALMVDRAEASWQAMPPGMRRKAVGALRVLNDAFAKAGFSPLNQAVGCLTVAKTSS